MPFVIQHGKITTVAPLAVGAGQASYKRFLEQQNAETARQAASMAFQSREREADREYQRQRDERLTKVNEQQAEQQFGRQKELIGLQADIRDEQRVAETFTEMAKYQAMQEYNNERKKTMEQYEYDLGQKRKLDSLDKADAYLDNLIHGEGRYAEDDPQVIEARMQIAAARAGVHREALPKPKLDPQLEVSKRVAMFDMPDGTKQQFYLDKDNVPHPLKDSSANREAVFGKVASDVWKSLSGKTNPETGEEIPVSEEEFNRRMDITMKARERFLGKQGQQATATQQEQPAQTAVKEDVLSKEQTMKRFDAIFGTKAPPPKVIASTVEQRIQTLPPAQRDEIEAERKRIDERIRWAKNSGSRIELAKAQEDLSNLINTILQAGNPSQPPQEPSEDLAGVM